jgi:hypothetical protein
MHSITHYKLNDKKENVFQLEKGIPLAGHVFLYQRQKRFLMFTLDYSRAEHEYFVCFEEVYHYELELSFINRIYDLVFYTPAWSVYQRLIQPYVSVEEYQALDALEMGSVLIPQIFCLDTFYSLSFVICKSAYLLDSLREAHQIIRINS